MFAQCLSAMVILGLADIRAYCRHKLEATSSFVLLLKLSCEFLESGCI